MADSGHTGAFRDKMDSPSELHQDPQGIAPSLRLGKSSVCSWPTSLHDSYR